MAKIDIQIAVQLSVIHITRWFLLGKFPRAPLHTTISLCLLSHTWATSREVHVVQDLPTTRIPHNFKLWTEVGVLPRVFRMSSSPNTWPHNMLAKAITTSNLRSENNRLSKSSRLEHKPTPSEWILTRLLRALAACSSRHTPLTALEALSYPVRATICVRVSSICFHSHRSSHASRCQRRWNFVE